jgi:hypothetical protein
MKAWLVRVKDEFYTEAVFAETRGKARSLALHTDSCDGASFTDIQVHRESQLDKYYKEGKQYMDWENPQDRIALVKECGFRCEYIEIEWCKDCPAKQYCDSYNDYIEEIKEDME